MSNNISGTLYLVATPIGNLSDISGRALKTLAEVDFIAAEDTRVTRKLLEHYEIKKPLVSYYHHNSRSSGEKILSRIITGENCALVTDAGTPGISDPGEKLVRLCADEDIRMVIIPGPCAAVSALALSGLSADRFVFEGFLPVEKKLRSVRFDELKNEKRSMIFYEAPHKLMRTLRDMLKVFGNRNASVSREMTKIYEETIRLPLSEIINIFIEKNPKGEFVIVIEGCRDDHEVDPEIILKTAADLTSLYMKAGMSVRDAVKKAADETGCSRNILYNSMIKMTDNSNENH